MGDFSEVDLRVSLRNEGRDYNEHFQTYKFYFSMRMTFVNEGDSLIFVADLLNAYGESLEDVFERVFHMCIGGVNLQHFNRNHLVDSDYVQFNIEHTDFTDYVYSSRNVKYSELNYAVLVGGVMNWLNNLAQSNRQMDINHDWSLSLQVSSTTNVHRGFGDPPTVDTDGDFLPEVVREGGGQSCSIAIPPLMERFHPDALLGNREEERALFGDITDDNGGEDDTEEEDSHSDDDDYFDEDNGTCEVLQNDAALDVFLTNELASLPPSVLRDYYELGKVQNTVLRGECLLISLYVHHLSITQPKNFSRIMKKSNWLTDTMIEKLQTISRGVSSRFGDNLKGRGHWEEIHGSQHCLGPSSHSKTKHKSKKVDN